MDWRLFRLIRRLMRGEMIQAKSDYGRMFGGGRPTGWAVFWAMLYLAIVIGIGLYVVVQQASAK